MENGEQFIIATVADLDVGHVFKMQDDYAVLLEKNPNAAYPGQSVLIYRYLGGEMPSVRSFTNNSIVNIYTHLGVFA